MRFPGTRIFRRQEKGYGLLPVVYVPVRGKQFSVQIKIFKNHHFPARQP